MRIAGFGAARPCGAGAPTPVYHPRPGGETFVRNGRWRGAGVAEQGCLLSSCAGYRAEGSNPSLSAAGLVFRVLPNRPKSAHFISCQRHTFLRVPAAASIVPFTPWDNPWGKNGKSDRLESQISLRTGAVPRRSDPLSAHRTRRIEVLGPTADHRGPPPRPGPGRLPAGDPRRGASPGLRQPTGCPLGRRPARRQASGQAAHLPRGGCADLRCSPPALAEPQAHEGLDGDPGAPRPSSDRQPDRGPHPPGGRIAGADPDLDPPPRDGPADAPADACCAALVLGARLRVGERGGGRDRRCAPEDAGRQAALPGVAVCRGRGGARAGGGIARQPRGETLPALPDPDRGAVGRSARRDVGGSGHRSAGVAHSG